MNSSSATTLFNAISNGTLGVGTLETTGTINGEAVVILGDSPPDNLIAGATLSTEVGSIDLDVATSGNSQTDFDLFGTISLSLSGEIVCADYIEYYALNCYTYTFCLG